jgi:uncharacterized protein (TIGR02594 family)
MATVPATIRYNNPGAMYPGAASRKFGGKAGAIIGGGHQIAEFPDKVSGAAAQFYLLASGYTDLSLRDALSKWSGGNDVETYVKRVSAATKLRPDDILTKDYIESPSTGIALAKAMAKHETGKAYPMTDWEWVEAHARAFPKALAVSGEQPFELAQEFIGTKEVAGTRDNPEIMRWYVDAGHPEIEHDETPNCAAFVCSMLHRTGFKNPETLLARDFLKYGEEIDEPYKGCIVVISRGDVNGWQGHVGFYDSDAGSKIKMLGANQGNSVNVMAVDKAKVLGYRKPIPGVKGVIETVNQSRTLKTLGNAIVTTIGTAVYTAWDFVKPVFEKIPLAVSDAESYVDVTKRLYGLLNIHWPTAFGVAVTVSCLAYVFLRGLGERRVQ